MLDRLKRKFHAVKYLFKIEVQKLEPWPSDDKPVAIFWQRGSKKSKRGQTDPILPVDVDSKGLLAAVPILQTISLTGTLYSASSKTKHCGPYQKKLCKLIVMQMDTDGEMLAMLGKTELNLAEIASPQETVIELPLDCDSDIRRAVGRPKLHVICRVGDKANPPKIVAAPKPQPILDNGKGGVAKPGTMSDPSTMGSDPMKTKRPGALTVEQETSLEGFDRGSMVLDSIQEIASPVPEGHQGDLADSAQDMTDAADSQNTSPHKEYSHSKSADAVLTAITEEIVVAEEPSVKDDGTTAAADQTQTSVEDSAHGDSPGTNEPQQDKEVSSMLDKWSTGTGKQAGTAEKTPKAEHSGVEANLGEAIRNWWSTFVAMLTCIPARPKDD